MAPLLATPMAFGLVERYRIGLPCHSVLPRWWIGEKQSATSTQPQRSLGHTSISWWRHQIDTFSALLAFCAGNSPVTGQLPSQRPVTRSFGVFFDLRMHKLLSKQMRRRRFGTPSQSLWRHCDAMSETVLIPGSRKGAHFSHWLRPYSDIERKNNKKTPKRTTTTTNQQHDITVAS